MDEAHGKKKLLEEYLKGLGSAAVAFSAGVDSTFLLKIAHDILGKNVIAVTACPGSFPKREANVAKAFCTDEGIEHVFAKFDELSVPGFSQNPKNRCYLCKKELLTKIRSAAAKYGIVNIIEGSNADDVLEYRPGMAAVKEQGVKSPLLEVGLTKTEIRLLSREAGLSTWDKQPCACLATRFKYGEEITKEKLLMVDRAEQKLIDMGFHSVRVRVHGSIARIETGRCEFDKMLGAGIPEEISGFFHEIGFLYVALDLDGYRTGSMDEALG